MKIKQKVGSVSVTKREQMINIRGGVDKERDDEEELGYDEVMNVDEDIYCEKEVGNDDEVTDAFGIVVRSEGEIGVEEELERSGMGKKILITSQRNDISFHVLNKIPIREYVRKKIYQTSKYKNLNIGAYYVHYDCYNNQKVWENTVMPCPWYGHEGCGFKLIIQTFICKLLPKK